MPTPRLRRIPGRLSHRRRRRFSAAGVTRPRKGEGAVGRVALTREPVQIADISDPTAYESRVRNTLLQIGFRALLAVPLIFEDQLVGALIVMRKRIGTFAAEEVVLLQTFATQSALAIQNARLFREIEDKSRQLEVASPNSWRTCLMSCGRHSTPSSVSLRCCQRKCSAS